MHNKELAPGLFRIKCGCAIYPETDFCNTHKGGHAYCHPKYCCPKCAAFVGDTETWICEKNQGCDCHCSCLISEIATDNYDPKCKYHNETH